MRTQKLKGRRKDKIMRVVIIGALVVFGLLTWFNGISFEIPGLGVSLANQATQSADASNGVSGETKSSYHFVLQNDSITHNGKSISVAEFTALLPAARKSNDQVTFDSDPTVTKGFADQLRTLLREAEITNYSGI